MQQLTLGQQFPIYYDRANFFLLEIGERIGDEMKFICGHIDSQVKDLRPTEIRALYGVDVFVRHAV